MPRRPLGPAFARVALTVLLALGVGVALYLVHHHENRLYGDATAVLGNCPQTEIVDCEMVNTSRWSSLAGVPIAAYAVPTYLLVAGLIWAGRTRTEAIAYAFGIGLLTTLASGFLFWVSKTQVGFLCAWCMRLYAINLAIPLLAAVAAGESPRHLAATAIRDLGRWPETMRRAAIAFAVLLALTIGAQQTYRSSIRLAAAKEAARLAAQGGPLVPAVPEGATPADDPGQGRSSSAYGEAPGGKGRGRRGPSGARLPSYRPALARPVVAAATPPAPAPAGRLEEPYGGQVFRLAGPLRRIGDKSAADGKPFDLQGRLGKGKPVALIFWAPGFTTSERALVRWAEFLSANAPAVEAYAVSGRREDQRDEEILETFAMLDLPPSLPLLVDDTFVVSNALAVSDVPNLALFDARGRLVVAKAKDEHHLLSAATGETEAGEIVRRVASGADVPQIKLMRPWYPADELLGRCAPAFGGPAFGTGAPFRFPGKPAGSKPTLVMFWSSTCKHCQIEIPQLVRWLEAHPGVVDVVGVTHIQKDKAGEPSHRSVTAGYIAAQRIRWPVVEDLDLEIGELYRNVSTPTTFVVAPSGKIVEVWYYAHPEGFDRAMDAAIAKARAAADAACAPAPVPPAPRLQLDAVAPNGSKVAVAATADKPTLVHFWATWCKPCVEELPALVRFRDAIERDGTGKVVFVSVEDAASGPAIAAFEKKLGLPLRSLRAPSGPLAARVDLAYRVPRTILIAPGGGVLDIRGGSQNWDDPAFAARIRARLRTGPSIVGADRR